MIETKMAATETLLHSSSNKRQQLSSISIMLEYDIDNTINTIKENSQLIKKMPPCFHGDSDDDSSSSKTSDDCCGGVQKCGEINNNEKNIGTPPTSNARKRWKILAKALRKDSEESLPEEEEGDELMASVRRFKSFDLVQQNNLDKNVELKLLGRPENWYMYRIRLECTDYTINIHHIDRQLTATDLMGFNNTGNICVWPSEEALTFYALAGMTDFKNKWILELGGGMTCLAGLMIAKYGKPYAVHLTDGNSVSVDNVRRTICLNELSCYTKCSVLKWENASKRILSEHEKFDYILSADCLFFDEARLALVDTLWYYLSPTGTGLVMAPQRGRTLTIFVEQCLQKGFICEIVHRYNDIIWQRHLELQTSNLYDEDIHYPVLIKLTKPQK